MNDEATTVAELRALVDEFVKARDWSQFHSPKNLCMAIAIESAELMEHFQWLDLQESRDLRESHEDFAQVREELADIMAFLLAFANSLDIDISGALRDKMVKNAQKYPADKFRGRFR